MSRAQSGGGGGSAAKLKASPRALFSCGIFSTCTHPALSPTATPNNNVVAGGGAKGEGTTPCAEASASPVVEAVATPPPPPLQRQQQPQAAVQRNVGPSSSSSSSSSSASQSFTQWRLPVHHPPQASASAGGGGAGDALVSADPSLNFKVRTHSLLRHTGAQELDNDKAYRTMIQIQKVLPGTNSVLTSKFRLLMTRMVQSRRVVGCCLSRPLLA